MFQEFISYWENIFDFDGRTQRKEYWTAILMNGAILFTLSAILSALQLLWIQTSSSFISILTILCSGVVSIYSLASVIASIAITDRRFHDAGYSGWILVVCLFGSFLFGIGSIVMFVICFLDSKPDNQWGENPKKNNTSSSYASLIAGIVAFIIAAIIYTVVLLVGDAVITASVEKDIKIGMSQSMLM